MTSSFRIKLKLAPKPVAAEGSGKQERQDGASSSTSSQKPVASTSKRKAKENKVKTESDEAAGGKRKRAAYSSSPESTRQSSSPRQNQQSSSIRGDASSLVGEDSDDEEEEDDSDEEDDDDDEEEEEEEGEEGEDESGEEEVDELEDSPPPASSSQAGSPRAKRVKMVGGTPKIVMARSGRGGRVLAGAAAGAHRKKLGLSGESESPEASIKPSSLKSSSKKATDESGSSKKRPTLLDDLPKPLDEMSLEEIDALPPSKRRKSLKLRGISGPGRGWRKGLKMDQRPLYGAEGETSSKHLQVAPSTPSSFSTSSKQRKASLARDAISASTPLRSESPYSRSSPAVGGNDAAAAATTSASGMATLKKRMAEELAQQKKQQQSTAAAISAAQAGEARAIKAIVKGAPTILPPNKVPGSFITITALDKTKKPARKWERRGREVLSLGGRAWSSATWITREERQFAPPPDPKAGATATAGNTLAGNSLAATRTATPVIAGAASGTATPIGASRLSGQGRGSATTAAHTSPVASLSPQQPIRASFLPPSKHASSGKTASIADKNARTASAIAASPSSKSSAAAAATTSEAARDWRGSSAAYTMANRGRGQ